MANTTEPTVTDVENQKKKEEDEEDSAAPTTGAEDEDTGAQVAPIVKLQEVAVTTGEEDEDVLLDLKAKLYRFDKDGNQWKERGAGTVKLLKHKNSGRVRLLMRQSKTLKICANHIVLPSISLQEHAGNEKSCVWQASDFSDGELKQETFAIRFASAENCRLFRDKVEEVAESQRKPVAETEEGSAAADLIQKLSVGGDDQEKKTEAKEESLAAEKKDQSEEKEKPADEDYVFVSK